jgi:site-specific recombinase XerD
VPLKKTCAHARGLSGCARDRAWRRCGCAWTAYFTVAGVRRHVNVGRDLAEALRQHDALERTLLTGGSLAPREDGSFLAVSERWLATKGNLREGTLHGYRSALAHARSWLAGVHVARISAAMLVEMEADLVAAGMAPLYARNARSVAVQVLGFAEDAGLISHTPRPRRRRKAPMQAEPRFLAPARLRAVARAARPDMATLFEFAWLTGLRAGELLALGPADIDGTVCRVRRAVEGRTRRIGPVKSRKARRDVDLSPRALAVLPQTTGERFWPLTYSRVLELFKQAMRRAGETPGGLHLLRHSNVALRIADGQELVYIADQLGHADPAFTLRVYGHLIRRPGASASSLDETIARLVAAAAV